MGTRTLTDIHNDIKLLVTTMTGFEENEEGFRICERFALSNIKHHRFLSVDSHATKLAISEIQKKFFIHGKYKVAEKFQELVDVFLSSFDFEHHPQYDLQWSLLSLLLELSTETHKSDLKSLKLSRTDCNSQTSSSAEDHAQEEIDWGQYLKEGQENFFCDYKSDIDSEWSDDDVDLTHNETCLSVSRESNHDNALALRSTEVASNIVSVSLVKELESRNWLISNVQHSWWNSIELSTFPIESQSVDARLCKIWQDSVHENADPIGTLSEYQVCRELLWMFHVQTDMVVFKQCDSGDFFINKNTSISSLSNPAFSSMLSSFCNYFSMIYKLEKFGSDLYAGHDELQEHKEPPLTYEAYYTAMQNHLLKYRGHFIDIEKDVMRQDTNNTLLSLSSSLMQYLKSIQILHEVHQTVISDWKVSPNWICASKLLSSLYMEMQHSYSREKTNICANLYLSCLTVYLNIIDTWLTEGRLEDWRDEFIIVRDIDVEVEEDNQCAKFTIRMADEICSKDPIMQTLIRKVQYMGHSIELLVSLDRIADMWKANTKYKEKRMCLNEEFCIKLATEISKYDSSDLCEEVRTKLRVENLEETDDIDVDRNIIQQLSAFNNPFLMKAFEEYIPPTKYYGSETPEKELLPILECEEQYQDLFERLEKISQYVLPLRKILHDVLTQILYSRYNSASKLVKDIMIQEYKLGSHLKLMRCVYMMETGHIMHKFNQILFSEIESNQIWNNSYYLSCILEEILSQQWPDSSSRWSITVTDVNTHLVMQAVDNIKLHYAIGWPVNIVLNEQALVKYNKVFRFQLKLKWALWTLNNLRFSDLEGSKLSNVQNKLEHFLIRRLESLRFWLLHAIGSIHAYLSGQVLQGLGLVLEKSLARAESVDTIIAVHNEYLDKVHQHCLLTTDFEDIMATIHNLIEMCIHVRDRWTRRKVLLASSELGVMENSYIKYHTYLALAFHNAVQNKDANYYELTIDIEPDFDSGECHSSTDCMSDLSRNLLAEVSYQYLPPSGVPIPIPKMIHRTPWHGSSQPPLPDQVLLNEYKETFSYMRLYQCEERFLSRKELPSYITRAEVRSLIHEAVEGMPTSSVNSDA